MSALGPSVLIGLALYGLAGCGFLSDSPFPEARPAEVAPWEDQGPIVVCDGKTRIGTSDSSPLGTCNKAGSATLCTSDSDCRSRERCTCGVCVRAVCDTSEECKKGTICNFGDEVCDRSCTTDGDCQKSERCVPGQNICRGDCRSSSDCQTGERCESGSGLCLADSCQDDSTCGGLACTLERIPGALSEPSPLVEGDRITLWFERAVSPGASPEIWRATSTDGVSFQIDPERALLAGRAPSVAHDPVLGYVLLYGSPAGDGAILRAASSDGIHFTEDAAPLLDGARSPSVVAIGGGKFAAYLATSDESAILRAASTDGTHFDSPTVVLTPLQVSDPVLWQAVDRLRAPFAEALTDVTGKPFVRLWFSGHGTESGPSSQFGVVTPTPPDDSIGEAASPDGIAFVPYPFDPVFDRTLEFLTHPSELEPGVVSFGGELKMYYRRAAADGSASENLALAHSPPTPP